MAGARETKIRFLPETSKCFPFSFSLVQSLLLLYAAFLEGDFWSILKTLRCVRGKTWTRVINNYKIICAFGKIRSFCEALEKLIKPDENGRES